MADKKQHTDSPAVDANTASDGGEQFVEVTDTLPLPSDHADGQDSTGGNAPHQPADITPTPPDDPATDHDSN